MSQGQTIPGMGAKAVTKSDSTVVAFRALWIGTAGDVAVEMSNGDQVTFANVNAGQLLPIAVQKVLSTGTSAADIVGIE